jgi:MFS family permease
MRGDMAQAEWVTAVYFLVLSGTLVGFGRASDRFGHRFVYLWGLTVFTLGSGVCGLAINMTVLIVFRAIQALGAAMISGTSMAILARHFPASQRGRSLGRQAAVTYIGLGIGPILGGFLGKAVTYSGQLHRGDRVRVR